MWNDPLAYQYEAGKLFLGRAQGHDIGIKTERHAITIAGAGSGKGATVIIPNLLRWPHNALVIDPKGEAAKETAQTRREKFGQAVHVVDPFNISKVDLSLKASYNPLAALDPASPTIKEDITAITDGIVMRADASASHWDDGAQRVINGLIGYVLLRLEPEKRTLIEVRKIIRNASRFDEVIEEMRDLSGCAGVCEAGASAVYAGEGKYFVSNAEKNTDWLDSDGMANALGSSSFSLSDLKNGKASVFLVLPANYLGQHGRFLRLFVRCAIEEMARPTPSGDLRGEQCLFILDEFFSLGYIDEISKAAGLMRGYGLQLWPILQDLGQLVALYGREGSETFFGNADLHQYFGATDQMTLGHISEKLGVIGMDEIPLPPLTPSRASGYGAGLSGVAGMGSHTGARVMGGILGNAISKIENDAHDRMQTRHQDLMQNYQREVSRQGRPRVPPEEVAKLVRKEHNVVADHSINFVFGSNKLLLNPAPYFIKHENESKEDEYLLIEKTIFQYKFSNGEEVYRHTGRLIVFSIFGLFIWLILLATVHTPEKIEALASLIFMSNIIGFLIYRIKNGFWTEFSPD